MFGVVSCVLVLVPGALPTRAQVARLHGSTVGVRSVPDLEPLAVGAGIAEILPKSRPSSCAWWL